MTSFEFECCASILALCTYVGGASEPRGARGAPGRRATVTRLRLEECNAQDDVHGAPAVRVEHTVPSKFLEPLQEARVKSCRPLLTQLPGATLPLWPSDRREMRCREAGRCNERSNFQQDRKIRERESTGCIVGIQRRGWAEKGVPHAACVSNSNKKPSRLN